MSFSIYKSPVDEVRSIHKGRMHIQERKAICSTKHTPFHTTWSSDTGIACVFILATNTR